jgi:hypothetical protein
MVVHHRCAATGVVVPLALKQSGTDGPQVTISDHLWFRLPQIPRSGDVTSVTIVFAGEVA